MNNSAQLASFQPHPPDAAGVLTWIHIGDLHMTRPGEQNDLDLQAIVTELNTVFAASTSFVFIPGDVADDGSRAAYNVVLNSLDRLTLPWCAIVGDHDVHEKAFTNFLHAMAERTHYAFVVGNTRFVAMNAFDIPDPGAFTVSSDQLTWIKRELQTAAQLNQTTILLLHCYPSDLKVGASELHEIVRNFGVRLIDMGHTHYNEISNDGHTLYTATRSTGQIEEGPVGFSITNLDAGVLSWRFVELDKLPVVMITSPSDERLLTEANQPLGKETRLRAKVWHSTEIAQVSARFQNHDLPMQRIPNTQIWETTLNLSGLTGGVYPVQVEAHDASGQSSTDAIRLFLGTRAAQQREEQDQANALEAWPEHGLLGTQLGPNKNGKKW